MARFPYHRLPSEYSFQDLVWDICRVVLGEGVEKFSRGKDGGRDGRFSGKANRFPSEASPLSGAFIVQVKWTEDESASFSDKAFIRLLMKEETPKAKKLCQGGELDHWIVVSNRKKQAISATSLQQDLLTAVGCKTVHLRGTEELDGWLSQLPDVVKAHDLDGLLIPFRVDPLELRDVIETLYANRQQALAGDASRWDYAGYAGIELKNKINNLTEPYFKASIRDKSEPYFAAIKSFLENPRNGQLAERYHEAASEIQAKAMAHRSRFATFDLVIEHVCDHISAVIPQPGKKRVLRVLLHYMYANCDVGQKSQ